MSVKEKNITINPIVNGVKDTNTNLYPKTKVENLIDFPSPASNFNKFLHTNALDGSIEWATVGVPTGAFSFIGTTTTALTDGSTTNPITIGGESVTATNGNVVIYGNKEFAWTGSYWEELGDEGVASSTILGNVKLGSDTTIDSTAAKTYPIQLNSNSQMFVNVPWQDVPDFDTDANVAAMVADIFVEYPITPVITNGTYSGNLVVRKVEGGLIKIIPNTGYQLPNSITVENSSYTYDSEMGDVILSNPTGEVTIIATCPEEL